MFRFRRFSTTAGCCLLLLVYSSLILNTSMLHAQTTERRLVFLGDSLTAGFGLELDDAYPALIQQKFAAKGEHLKVVNAGVSGDTSAGGLRRLEWILRDPVDTLVLALGANDGLRGLEISQLETNLRSIIQKTRAKNPKVRILLAGMLVPPNQGATYAENYREAFERVSKREGVTLIPFLLDSVAGISSLNQADGIHPNEAGQKIIAETVWKYLEPVVTERKE